MCVCVYELYTNIYDLMCVGSKIDGLSYMHIYNDSVIAAIYIMTNILML